MFTYTTTTTTTNNALQNVTNATRNMTLNEAQDCVPTTLSTLWTSHTMQQQRQQPVQPQRQTRCGTCHFYKQDNRFQGQYTNGKTRHQCPIPFCSSFDICGYKAGHVEQLRERRNKEKKQKIDKKMRDLKLRSEARVKAAKERKAKKLKLKKDKEDKKKKHLFARAHKLSTYLRNIGVEET